ncbi:MAG: type II secretion system minor pseudopilin GspH [Gammaproteobacteria bacterium]|nr:type II secretion system minor pseudopilin GspH [Gammaproteobacteria bacterium]
MGKAGRPRVSGFTLVEILAVVVIIGIVSGLAVISINALGNRSSEGQTAIKLAGLIQLASNNARMENLQYGLRVEPHHYEFMVFNGHGGWLALTKSPVFDRHELPDGLSLTVSTEHEIRIPVIATAPSAATAGPAADDADMADAAVTPQIAILSTGEITPFTLRLTTTGGKTYLIRGSGNGRVHVVPPGSINAPAIIHYQR